MKVQEVLFILIGGYISNIFEALNPLRSFKVDFLKVRVICANHENSGVWDEIELGEESLALNNGWFLLLCIIPFLVIIVSVVMFGM
eukprot:snap_masked-scaffold_86-processed-gene-0.5-mRNA-1 protein AED:1.00 eAED:1.00 QI:0/0/0/0/1/1/2/0/85